ncbi:MAG: protein tyrosine phosphatase [Actinomycetota bacterium]|nr:protein tyrosine phosphatase [Actinomycetota bacterium]
MTTSRLPGAIELPDGSWVRGRGLRNPAPIGATPDLGLYLGTARLRRAHGDALTWPHEWLDWPDFRLPRDRDAAIERIGALHDQARSGRAVEIACAGGMGRTGTAIACLAVLAGVPALEAVAWTRANYHKNAVETPWQRAWVTRFPVR